MAVILPLTQAAITTVKRLAFQGKTQDAYSIMRNLLSRPEAKGSRGARWHRLAATLCIQSKHFRRALKHLRLAYREDKSNKELALRISKWYAAEGDDHRASRWRRRSGVDRITQPRFQLKLYSR